MTSTQELTQKTKTQLTNPAELAEWGGQVVTANDIIIPKILPLNFMSEKVKNKLGEYGDFRDTLNNQKHGDLKTPFEFIPVAMEKKWLEFDVVANKAGAKKREFKRTIPVVDVPGADYNDDLPYAEEGLERDRVMDFYVLLPNEVALYGTGAMPYVLSFKRTSLKAGKKLATQMFLRNAGAGKSPAAVTCLLSGTSVQNDDGEYVVQDVTPSRETTATEVAAALFWYKKIRAGQTKVMEDEHEDEVQAAKPVNRAEF